MPKFVANGWAAKDYTHINFHGGRSIAKELAMAIISQVRVAVEEREAEQFRQEELERQHRAELERQRRERNERLQLRVDAVNSMINGVELTVTQ
jgi:hypothetical protein